MSRPPTSAFPQSGWELIYDLRDAVRAGATGTVHRLVDRIDDPDLTQLATMAHTMLGYYLGFSPTDEKLRITARVLHIHLAAYDDGISILDIDDVLTAVMKQQPLPRWLNPGLFFGTLVAFLLPDGDAEMKMREDLEPLWARAMES
ncbi:hypothetical protein QSJ18_13390 [Gordonia sp. ABSL1-1]|uniref:hypothetical protein n=1 Tax=Gordonia sp. ABSL1-1 TaxID=3053923 RepID=UPI002573B7F0|nr:hypothetical protein [Gordonia sp. ABSL1-1]MDL9937741.1 hypothetical protein [Gordonia sp. ABSL1-1]